VNLKTTKPAKTAAITVRAVIHFLESSLFMIDIINLSLLDKKIESNTYARKNPICLERFEDSVMMRRE
jgi:hypothetical protein